MNKLLAAVIILALFLTSCYASKEDKEEMSRLAQDHFKNLAFEIRESGVTSISIDSMEVKPKWRSAVAALNITFNVYNPTNQETRQDKDVAAFYFKKSKGEWIIQEIKYEKTRW